LPSGKAKARTASRVEAEYRYLVNLVSRGTVLASKAIIVNRHQPLTRRAGHESYQPNQQSFAGTSRAPSEWEANETVNRTGEVGIEECCEQLPDLIASRPLEYSRTKIGITQSPGQTIPIGTAFSNLQVIEPETEVRNAVGLVHFEP